MIHAPEAAPAPAAAPPHDMHHGPEADVSPDHHTAEVEFPVTAEPAMPPGLRAALDESRDDLEESRKELGPTARDLEAPPG